MKINFKDIKPHVRLARVLNLDSSDKFIRWTPYDARLFFAMDGHGQIETENGTYDMYHGDMLFINSGKEYKILTPKLRVSYYFIAFDYVFSASDKSTPLCPEPSESFNAELMPAHVTFSDLPELSEELHVSGMESLFETAKSMIDEFSHSRPLRELRLSSDMTELLVSALRKHGNSGKKRHSKADKILEYVNNNYHLPLLNEEIAKKFHYHPNHLNSIVKAETGRSLRDYINSVRVERAAEMLLNTDTSVSEIALACGFYDTPHFIRCFSSIMKTSPGRYRASYI
jgi:AraC-like DNA-binding protein